MDKMGSYRLDRAFTQGVDIPLDDADVVCCVRLPSQYNRAYTQALYDSIDFDVKADGSVNPKGLMTTRYAQEDAFVAHCLLTVDGEPVPDGFATDYPAAIAELMTKAQELANELDDKVADSTKKSSPTSTGKSDGVERKSSTQSLSSAVG